ncbi:MAG: 2OG-Fe(II) oxygenase [Kofleriaceae bacterium]
MELLIPGRDHGYLDGDSFDYRGPLAFTLPAVMSPTECAQMIARIEALGPSDAPVTTASGAVMRPEVRNNQRVMFDDVALASTLFARIAVPESLCDMRAVGINERFRCYRYEPGQRFAPHRDGYFARNDQERSLLTFMVYLNDDFTGGETAFLGYACSARPRVGTALLFQHLLDHEGCVVKSGVKYVLRSDVMYRSEVSSG